ncbi:7884_t:CDS:2 [Ambispora gerdemannii]|uniref:cAMP-dependent protein kinase regulatory subunit n=1 Tax=Ambispora gerdemannii TaxID=144530 RepID=A0A9N9GBB8_9GLOM|nr:7884_t:CDS:2 [Ambispora gerdemannii]
MQDTRTSYYVQNDLERMFDELKGVLLRHQPTAPVEFAIGCLNAIQQKKRESNEPLQYSKVFSEYAYSIDTNSQRNNPPKPKMSHGLGKKRLRADEEHITSLPYPTSSTSSLQPFNEENQSQRYPPFASSSSIRTLSPRFQNNQPPPFSKNRRNSVSAESIRPSEHCNNFPLYVKDAISKRQIEEATQNNLLFRDMDKEIKDKVLDAMFEKPVKKDEVVIRQGDEGDNFYVVTHGMFEISVNGRVVITVADGGSFGELALMYNTPRAATVKAITDGTLWAVDRRTFLSTIATYVDHKRKSYESFLTSIDIFNGLHPSEISKLADALEPVEYRDGDKIIKQGDPGDYFYIIEEGYVGVWKEFENGNNHYLSTLSNGHYFGELALIEDKPRKATIIAKGSVKLVALKRDAFDRLLGSIGKVMDIISKNAQSYDIIEYQHHQPLSPASPVPESMVIDSIPTSRDQITTRRSGYSGAGGVNVL